VKTRSRKDHVGELSASLAAHGAARAKVALVLGSGLGALADQLHGARAVAFEDLEGMPRTRVHGHAGRVVLGELGGVPVLAQQGRVHLYEGWSAATVTRSVRAYARLGIRTLVLTNAAGGLVVDWPIPTLMRIEDHINLQGRTPLGPRERGLGSPYDVEAGAVVDRVAGELGMHLARGVYAGLSGPSYETPAEIRHLVSIGAHAVGMSTVAEALAGHASGMQVIAISCISNPGAGLTPEVLDHAEVLAAGRAIAGPFAALLEASVKALAN